MVDRIVDRLLAAAGQEPIRGDVLAQISAELIEYHHENAALQERLGNLESLMIEQERTIRHTLTMLIDWIERDEARGVAA